jgi:hypothetical protein
MRDALIMQRQNRGERAIDGVAVIGATAAVEPVAASQDSGTQPLPQP